MVDCPDLNAPLNGALACDEWLYGLRCQMFCNEKWDIPRGVPDDGAWVCSQTTGQWLPNVEEVPDCTGRIALRGLL